MMSNDGAHLAISSKRVQDNIHTAAVREFHHLLHKL